MKKADNFLKEYAKSLLPLSSQLLPLKFMFYEKKNEASERILL